MSVAPMPYRRIHSRHRRNKHHLHMAGLRHLDEDCVEKYQSHFPWLRDRKFLNDLESDSVDSEILEEELSALQDDEPSSARQRVAKCLQSHPVQIVLCVLVLLDAGIVIAQILLDLHYFRGRHHSCEDDMNKLISYVRNTHLDELSSYQGSDIDTILEHLKKSTHINNTPGQGSSSSHKSAHINFSGISKQSGHSSAPHMQRQFSTKQQNKHGRHHISTSGDLNSSNNNNNKRTSIDSTTSEPLRDSSSLKGSADYIDGDSHMVDEYYTDMDIVGDLNSRQTTQLYGYRNRNLKSYFKEQQRYQLRHLFMYNTNSDEYDYPDDQNEAVGVAKARVSKPHASERHVSTGLHDAAHYLHIASICILGFLVVEDIVKAVAMGREFFKHKVEVFDAIIIVSSFVVDLVFLGGVPGDEGEKAAAVLVVLLLWRIARVVDGIVITVKQKQEFRIRLQKRARRKAEKRIDGLEEERHYKSRQIQALKELCQKSGIMDEDIEACLPKKTKRTSSTANALTSVARLSVSMTMSMSSGLFSLVDDTDKSEEFPSGKSPCSDVTFARWKRDSSSTQEDGISLDLGRANKTLRGMSLPDFRQRGYGLSQSPTKKDMILSTSPYNCKRELKLQHSPGQKREMLYSSAQHQTIKEESPGASATTSPVNASGVAIVIDAVSDNESTCSNASCDNNTKSCDHVVDIKSCDQSTAVRLTSSSPGDSDSFLSSDHSFETDRRDSNQSQAFLLNEMERD